MAGAFRNEKLNGGRDGYRAFRDFCQSNSIIRERRSGTRRAKKNIGERGGKIIELWTVLCLRLEFGNQVRCLRRLKENGHSPHSILPSLFLSPTPTSVIDLATCTTVK